MKIKGIIIEIVKIFVSVLSMIILASLSLSATLDEDAEDTDNAPTADTLSVSTDKNTSVVVTLSSSDLDGDTITYTIVNNPSNGILSGTAPTLIYAPNNDYTGSDSFVYKVCDAQSCNADTTVNIMINNHPANTPDGFEIIWKGSHPNTQVYYGSAGTQEWENGGSAEIDKILITNNGITRLINGYDFIFSDTVESAYEYIGGYVGDLNVSKTTGHYLCSLAPQDQKCVIDYYSATVGTGAWDTLATQAFADRNLNHYIGQNLGGVDFDSYETRDSNTSIHRLTYEGDGIKVGFEGDGYFMVSERGGNNSFLVIARDKDKNELGHVFINKATGGERATCSLATNDTPYKPSGRMQENFQEICLALYPLQALATPGQSIKYIDLWAVGRDHGDGKILVLHTLKEPEVCYDYTIRKDGHTIPATDREFSTFSTGDIVFTVALQSTQSDFDMKNSRIKVGTQNLSFQDSFYSRNNINAFIPAIETDSFAHEIAIGKDIIIANPQQGGTMGSLERYYSKFVYSINEMFYSGKFEVDLNVSIDLSGVGQNYVTYLLTTDENKLGLNSPYTRIIRCPQNKIYNPEWGKFNIERPDSGSDSNPDTKYNLHTQVAGKDFDISAVVYSATSGYKTTESVDGYSMEIELIDVSAYDDNNSIFKCENTDPEIVQNINNGNQVFLTFSNSDRATMDPEDNLITDTALRNAAFRMWVFEDENGTIIQQNCADNDGCYGDIYDTYYKQDDASTQYCLANCSSGSGCYDCLKKYYGKTICSRDNFSIRPAAYRLHVSDTNEQTDVATPTIRLATNDSSSEDARATLAAGYLYKLEGEAQTYPIDGTMSRAKGYSTKIINSDNSDFVSRLYFKDSAQCYDQNDTDWNIYFDDGAIYSVLNGSDINITSGNLVKHSNTGKYSYHLYDQNWTLVDQKRYAYKTFPGFDDCIPDSTIIAANNNEKSGCAINSKATVDGNIFNDLYLMYQPYKFSLADINFSISPDSNYLFMTDFDDPYYQTASSFVKTMAAIHEGNITALGKTNIITTNFTDGCVAEDVTIVLNRDTNDTEENLETLYEVKIQQYLSYGSSVDTKTTFDDKQEGKDANLTLSKVAFEDGIAQGSAKVRIYTNFKKPAKDDILGGSEGVDPIAVNYLEINATSIDANSLADMSVHIPKGTKNFDRNVTFVYGIVVPNKKLYIETEHNWQRTPLYVNIYCSAGSILCADRYGLNTSSLSSEASGNWHQASNLFDNDADIGTSNINVTHFGGRLSDPRISHGIYTNQTAIDSVGYDHITASQTDINVSIQSTDPKPTVVKVEYLSDPWLKYKDDFYDVRFMPKPTGWTGFGKTGHVVDDDINTHKIKRVEW